VPISKIKRRNQLDGDAIYYLKQVVIPNPKNVPEKQARTQ
jgi:hypothetical protein